MDWYADAIEGRREMDLDPPCDHGNATSMPRSLCRITRLCDGWRNDTHGCTEHFPNFHYSCYWCSMLYSSSKEYANRKWQV